MNRNTQRRLERLEQETSPQGRTHILWAMTEAEYQEREAALVASPAWADGDSITWVSWMQPETGATA